MRFFSPRVLSVVLMGLAHFSCATLSKTESALVDAGKLLKNSQIDLRYATENNRTGQRLYSSNQCLLRPGTAQKLLQVEKELNKQKLRLKIWDAYRPLSVQRLLWAETPDDRYVTPPDKGSDHNRGAAVDVTLTDWQGNELEMGTPFDYFSRAACFDFKNLTKIEIENRKKLRATMLQQGFLAIPSEWWHFYDSDWASFKVLDV